MPGRGSPLNIEAVKPKGERERKIEEDTLLQSTTGKYRRRKENGKKGAISCITHQTGCLPPPTATKASTVKWPQAHYFGSPLNPEILAILRSLQNQI
jgi:hypothetical protein